MRYLKDSIKNFKEFITGKKREQVEQRLAEGLTKEQKKKYRKQYNKLAIEVFLISTAYITGIIALIQELFTNDKIWAIALITLIGYNYQNLTMGWSHESQLIQERIKKRSQKNKKQKTEE